MQVVGISELACDVCGAGMKQKHGEWGSFYACSRYPHCTNKVTEAGLRKRRAETAPIEELLEEGLLHKAPVDRLKEYLRDAGQKVCSGMGRGL